MYLAPSMWFSTAVFPGKHAQVVAAESRLDGLVRPFFSAASGGPCASEEVGVEFLLLGGQWEAAIDFSVEGTGAADAVGFGRLAVWGGTGKREEAEQQGRQRTCFCPHGQDLQGQGTMRRWACFVPIGPGRLDEKIFNCPGVEKAQADFLKLVGG